MMKYRFGWSVFIEQISCKWRIKTGTFIRVEAKKAEKKIKEAELSRVTDVIAE